MKILVTGAKGFVGKNLCATLYNIRDGKDRTRPGLKIEEVFEYDIDTDPSLLDVFCQKADFVFNLAGVNRPKETAEFMEGNFGLASLLLDTLKAAGNRCPVMVSSSVQASLSGRFGKSEYGLSMLANSITLTPGTITVDLHDGEYLVHGLDKSLTEDIKNCCFFNNYSI